MNADPEQVELIRLAGSLHDLGKLAIPDEILSKPAELADPEWRVVAEHPKIGQVVLEQAGALRDAATIVLHHHEWYDGRGYPHGLSGEEIPIGARIVSIADAYEAMIAGRPYRPAISHAEALAELQRHGGVQFDPELVAAFIGLFEAGMPWAIDPSEHQRGHGHPHADASDVPPDRRSHAEIHDQLHERRRRVVAGQRPNLSRAVDSSLATGTAG
jgi:HD-GYP domain-containing protein (c-di-GMP phosphodiesterase class II)